MRLEFEKDYLHKNMWEDILYRVECMKEDIKERAKGLETKFDEWK